jgi:hypothetical protein
MDEFLDPYTAVMHARNLLDVVRRNPNVEECFLHFCARAEMDSRHTRNKETFIFVIKSFFCYERSDKLFRLETRQRILSTWDAEHAAAMEKYSVYEHGIYRAWFHWTYETKKAIFEKQYADFRYRCHLSRDYDTLADAD